MGNRQSRSVSLRGDSFDGAVQQLSQVFGKFDGRPTDAATDFKWAADITRQGGLRLVSGYYEGEWDLWPVDETPEMLSILHCRNGAMRTFLGSKPIESTATSLLLTNNIEAGRYTLRGSVNMSDALFVEWKQVARTIAGLFDRPLNGPLDLAPEVDSGNLASIYHLIESVMEGMRPGGALLKSPLAAAQLTEALTSLLILNVPNRFTQYLDGVSRAIAPRQVKQAVDFMQEHIADPITIQTVAKAVGVSTRSLELSFREFKGVTPSVYLRQIRLQAAHSELIDPASTLSIADLCVKWGFFHFGRFSELYRKAYGVSPSEARRQSARPGSP